MAAAPSEWQFWVGPNLGEEPGLAARGTSSNG